MEKVYKDEDENDDAGGVRSSHVECRRACCPDDERYQHPDSGPEEECPSAKTIDEESSRGGGNKVENLQDAVDKSLRVGICDANCVEHQREIIRDDS